LRWPTSLAINPIDDTLHILDDNVVLNLSHDGKLVIIAGRPLYCPPSNTSDSTAAMHKDKSQILAIDTALEYPQDISFSPSGDLFIVESNSKNLNQVRRVEATGHIALYVGTGTQCNCRMNDCKCEAGAAKDELATSFPLDTPTSITVTPDEVLHIADMGNLRLHSIVTAEPLYDKLGQYEVTNHVDNELYVFNRYGQHVLTRNSVTYSVMYNFTYNVNSPYGKLAKVKYLFYFSKHV